jgi:hypothetical protein
MIVRYLRLAVVFVALNLVWELLQLPLYTIWWSEPWPRIAFALFHCTLGDLLIGAVAFTFALVIGGQGSPADRPARIRVVVITTAIGTGYTVFSEWLNVEVRQTWAYTEMMPRLPFLGTGLMPLLQWLLLPGIAITLVMAMTVPSVPEHVHERAK